MVIFTQRSAMDSNSFKKDLSEHGQLLTIEVSPFDLSQDVILLGFQNKILLGQIKIDDGLDVEILTEFKHTARCTTLSISPDTCLSTLPNNIQFTAGGNDFKLRVFSSDLKGNDTCNVLAGHDNYVNDTKYDPENNYIASVSDDNTVRLWEIDSFNCAAVLRLTSPGISTCWHRDDNSKLLVAEKIGLIRFYNVESHTPILSLDLGRSLSGAHWAPSDPQLVASLQLGELFVWDLTKPCVPINNNLLFTESGGCVKFSPFGELIAAVNSLESCLKVVHVLNRQQKLSVSVTLPTNVCWHFRYPVVFIGDDTKLCFWKVVSK